MVRKLALYLLTTISLIVSQVAAIPILIGTVGAHAWSGLAVGQSIGTMAALFAQLGWPITGPAEVAAADSDRRKQIYGHSLIVRSLLVVPVALVAAVACYLVVGPASAAALAAVATTAVALSPGWYYVGAAEPLKVLLVDSVPRALSTLVGAGIVALGGPLYWFPLVLLVAPLLSCTVATMQLKVRIGDAWATLTRDVIRGQMPGSTQSVIASSYKFLPLIVVSALTSASVTATYALADRFLKLGLAGMRPMTQVLQGWVPAGRDSAELVRRSTVARRATIVVGATAAVAFTFLAGPVGQLMSQGAVHIPIGVAAFLGISFGLSLISLTSGLVIMVARDLKRYLATGAAIAAVLCLVTIAPLTMLFAAVGAAASVAMSEVAVQSYQTWRLRRSG